MMIQHIGKPLLPFLLFFGLRYLLAVTIVFVFLLNDFAKDIFGGLSQDDLAALMSAITEHGLDEKKIVEAYLEQKTAERVAEESAAAEYDGPVTKESDAT